MISAAAALDGKHIDKYDLFVFKYADGTYTWIEMDKATKRYSAALRNMSAKQAVNFTKLYKVHRLVELSADEFTSSSSELNESRHEMKLRHDKMLAEAKHRIVVESVCKQLLECMPLNESAEDKELEKELKEKLAEIKTPEDLKKFMKENADEIKASYEKADKKTKPFYKKAWDWLCGATEKTAGFLLDHIGGILMLAGILYAGHLIGWSRIKEFFTGKNADADKQTSEIMGGEQKRF